jgi:hypothetical protein
MSLLEKKGDQVVWDKLLQYTARPEDEPVDRGETGRQFSSYIYPYDHTSSNPEAEKVYPGNNRIDDRRSVSSKLAMYTMMGMPEEIAAQSHELKEMSDSLQQIPGIQNIIRIGIQQMLFVVLRRAHLILTPNAPAPRVVLDAIALTVPAQWTIEFEEEYGQVFAEAWARVVDYPPPQIIFLHEGQTNAHFVFWRGTDNARTDREMYLPESQQDIFTIGRTTNAVLIIDAGGHSTVSSF